MIQIDNKFVSAIRRIFDAALKHDGMAAINDVMHVTKALNLAAKDQEDLGEDDDKEVDKEPL
jgi:hypothetical protein